MWINSEFNVPTAIPPGRYVADMPVELALSHGHGDSRRRIQFSLTAAGQSFDVGQGVNDQWWGGIPIAAFGDVVEAVIEEATP